MKMLHRTLLAIAILGFAPFVTAGDSDSKETQVIDIVSEPSAEDIDAYVCWAPRCAGGNPKRHNIGVQHCTLGPAHDPTWKMRTCTLINSTPKKTVWMGMPGTACGGLPPCEEQE